jgi:hypothetical protein
VNPMHRDTDRSAGLHLFQELSTLGQQLAHTLLLRQGFRGVNPMSPASMSRTLQLSTPVFAPILRDALLWLESDTVA